MKEFDQSISENRGCKFKFQFKKINLRIFKLLTKKEKIDFIKNDLIKIITHIKFIVIYSQIKEKTRMNRPKNKLKRQNFKIKK